MHNHSDPYQRYTNDIRFTDQRPHPALQTVTGGYSLNAVSQHHGQPLMQGQPQLRSQNQGLIGSYNSQSGSSNQQSQQSQQYHGQSGSSKVIFTVSNPPNYQQQSVQMQEFSQQSTVSAQNRAVFLPPPQLSVTGLVEPPLLAAGTQKEVSSPDSLKKENLNSNLDQGQVQSSVEHENQLREIAWGGDNQDKSHSPSQGGMVSQPQQSEEQEHAMGINNTFWEQKFFMIYEKFEWFGERFEMIKSDYYSLSEQLQTVDSEDDWNQLKLNHEELAEKLEEMFQELIAVADENQQLMNQKLGQQGQSVWERRYHELLSNFKALQEQSAQIQAHFKSFREQQGAESSSEKQNKLIEHCSELEEEYNKVVNEYNRLREEYESYVKQHSVDQENGKSDGPTAEEFQHMKLEYQRNIEEMQTEYAELQNTCEEIFQEKQQLKQQLSTQQSSEQSTQLGQALQQKENQVQSLFANINQLNNQLRLSNEQKNSFEREKQEFIRRVESQVRQLREKDDFIENQKSQIRKYRDQTQTLEIKVSNLKSGLRQAENHAQRLGDDIQMKFNSDLTMYKADNDRMKRQNTALAREISTVREDLEKMHAKQSQKEVTKFLVDGLEKKMSFLRQQNEELQEVIKQKNTQLLSLRGVYLELQSYQNILEQYQALQREKLNIEEILKRERSQTSYLKRKITELEAENENLASKRKSEALSGTGSHQSQLAIILEQTRQVLYQEQNQNSKLKKLIQAKQNYIDQSEQQYTKLNISLEHQQKLFENQRSEHKSALSYLELKVSSLQKKNNSLQFTFTQEMKQTYEREIADLRKANETKQNKISTLQRQVSEIKSKSIVTEKNTGVYSRQKNTVAMKISALENSKKDILSKLEINQKELHNREIQLAEMKQNEQLTRSQINSLTVQVDQADILIQNKNRVIEDFQRQNKQFLQKIEYLQRFLDDQRKRKENDIKRNFKEVDKLKARIQELEGDQRKEGSSRLNRNNHSSPQNANQLNLQSLQANIVQSLTEQNNKLKNDLYELTKKVNEMQSVSRLNFSNLLSSPSKSNDQKDDSLGDRNAMNIEERLAKFNQRLQNCIQENRAMTEGGNWVDLNQSQRVMNYEKERRQLQARHDRQIRELKNYIAQLQAETQSQAVAHRELSARVISESQANIQELKSNRTIEIMKQEEGKSLSEQNAFLTQKLAEQARTNSMLIKLNEQLKQQVEDFVNMKKHSTTEYYKLQYKESDRQNGELSKNIKKLRDQNRQLRHQIIQHDTQLAKEYELKLFEAELKLHDIQREVAYLNIDKAKGDNQRANLSHDVNVHSSDLEALKTRMEAKIIQLERTNYDLKHKCEMYEAELKGSVGGDKFKRTTDFYGSYGSAGDRGSSPSFGSKNSHLISNAKMVMA